MKKIMALVLTGIFLILSAATCMAEDCDWEYEDGAEYYCYEDDYDDCYDYGDYCEYDDYGDYDEYEDYCEYDDYSDCYGYDDYDYCEYDDYYDYEDDYYEDDYDDCYDYNDDCEYADYDECDAYGDDWDYEACDYLIDGEENLDVIIEDMEDEYGTCEYLGALRVHSTEGSVPMYNTDQGNAQILCYVPDNEYVYDCILEEDGLVICSYQGYAGYIPAKFLNDECYYDWDEDEVEEEEEGCEEAFWEELSEPDDVVAEQYEIQVTTNESSQHIDEVPQAAEHGWLKIGGVNGCWRCEGCGGVFLTNMGWQLHSLSTPYWDPCHYVGSGYWQWWD